MFLPTRAQFLATGLVPVSSTEKCSICLNEPMTSPTQLPCNHTFCKECITEWLNQGITNSCAMCRRTLFTTPQEPADPSVQAQLRQVQLTRALRASGLARNPGHVAENIPDTAPWTAVETWPGRMHVDYHHLHRCTMTAFATIYSNTVPVGAGWARIHKDQIAASVIAMSNLLKHMATQEARPYGAAGWSAWREVAGAVYTMLAEQHGSDLDAMLLPNIMMQTLRRALAHKMGTRVRAFFDDAQMRGDLDMLIGFVVNEARKLYQDDTLNGRAHRAIATAAPRTTRFERARRQYRENLGRSERRSEHVNTVVHGHADAQCSVM